MNPQNKAKIDRINAQKFARAQELLALAELSHITIGFERVDGEEYVTFHPADTVETKLIEEVTILKPYIKRLIELKHK